ncbi:ejaculatory bulb-specific protein 3 isoform X2 [Amyelois transitella]|uniref:ejaculatory bulb-specific protein 3 isoform X2 n=1 Tax=Amyelois transitella TaxID=680683 RepID=UPI00298FF28B|nr:ejaculatory bulb-specific protein 3 isoform X2 [Amyelois transitella]
MSDLQLDRTLTDRSTMQRHLKCALGEGPCDTLGRRLRTLAPLVLRGACPQCTPHETMQIRRTLAFVQRNYPWEWARIITHIIVLSALVAVAYSAETTRPPVSDTALEEALNDKRFIQRQLKCALGEAPCDPIGKRLKTLAPLVLRGACPQCTPQETKQIQRTLSYVQRNFPQQWAKIVRQYAG